VSFHAASALRQAQFTGIWFMKKILSVAAVLAGLSATPAFAQAVPTFGDNLTVNLAADVAARCDARLNGGDGTVLNIDFDTLSSTDTAAQVTRAGGSVTYICNDPDGFTRTITSANGGFLTLNGAATTANNRRIRYTVQHGGGSGLGFAETQLTAPVAANFGAMLSGQTGGLTFRANGVSQLDPSGSGTQVTTVFAGDYSDVVTIAIAAR
jgi:hypothetical protein